MRTRIVTLILFLWLTNLTHGAKILGIFPLPGRSHYILGSSLMRGLAEKGHDVTVINPFGEKNPPKGGQYRDILLPELVNIMEEGKKNNDYNFFEMGDTGAFVNVPLMGYLMSDLGEWTLKETNVQNLIKSGEKFDAVIIEQFYDDGLKLLAPHFGGVQILFSTMGSTFWLNPLVGNPSPVSYIPDLFLSYSPNMTFCERLSNTVIYLLNVALHHLYLYPKYNSVAKQYIPNPQDLQDTLYNVSLVLLNSHPSLNQPVPHVPNMIAIGGFHIKPPKKLPKDLQQFLDDAKNGAIYFSMGSNLQSKDLPLEKREAILKVFSNLKQKVLWKWEEDVLPGQPENVKLSKWFPQQDILAHPNVKLFITHGGLLSTSETVYFGVPVLAIPIYGDQSLNAQNAVNSGFGLVLQYKELSEEIFAAKINEILTNPKYTIAAKSKSKIFHDREVKPLDEAAYWVDYVIRHKGAPHLRVAGIDLPWYKYLLLDVIAALSVIILIVILLTYFILKKVYGRCCAKKQQRKFKKN